MKGIISLLTVGMFTAGMVGISSICVAQEKIVIVGTGDSQKLLRILARAFEEANPGTIIEVPESIGSSGGIRSTAEGKCDLGRVARTFKEKEKKYNLKYKQFAYSPIVFAVNSSVLGVDNLTTEQIVDIYSGKITLWSDLGGAKRKIYVANREEGDSSRTVLEENLAGFKDIETFAGKIVYSTPETVEIIAKHRNTIGYIPLSMVKGTDLIVMKVDGVYPSLENVQNGSYKLLASFGIVWKGNLEGLAKAFVEFLFSSEAQEIITENGAIPVVLEE